MTRVRPAAIVLHMAKTPTSTLTPLTDEQVEELALAIFKNETFTDRHIAPGDESLIPTIFLPLGMLDRKQALDLRRKQRPGMLYASMSKAGPRAINGYPMFFEVSMCSEPDASKIWTKYREISNIGHDAHDKEPNPVGSAGGEG